MEEQTDLLGISSPVWRVIVILGLVAGGILLCALAALFFGLDIGLDIS